MTNLTYSNYLEEKIQSIKILLKNYENPSQMSQSVFLKGMKNIYKTMQSLFTALSNHQKKITKSLVLKTINKFEGDFIQPLISLEMFTIKVKGYKKIEDDEHYEFCFLIEDKLIEKE